MATLTIKEKILSALETFWNLASQTVVQYDDVVNNCTSSSDAAKSLPLSAYQGYLLQDQINTLNSNNLVIVKQSFSNKSASAHIPCFLKGNILSVKPIHCSIDSGPTNGAGYIVSSTNGNMYFMPNSVSGTYTIVVFGVCKTSSNYSSEGWSLL